MSATQEYLELKEEVREYFDAKKVLPKIGGKRPGKKCGKSYIAADRKCKGHYSESGKLTEQGKASAQELAGKVRGRKGMKPAGISTKDPSTLGENTLNLSGRSNLGREGYITTTSYKRKGYTGYLAKLSDDGSGNLSRSFINSSDQDRETYQGKMGQHHYKLSDLPDGVYEAETKEGGYNTRGASKYHFEVKKGLVTRQFDDLGDAKKSGMNIKPKSEGLPELQGSEKQVGWANSLREKGLRDAIAQAKSRSPGEHHQLIEEVAREIGAEMVSAKEWIDNRGNLTPWLLKQMQNRANQRLQK